MKRKKPKIEPLFRNVLPPLTDEEFRGLERSIISQGCVQPLVVWKERHVLLDGYNRYAICEENQIKYEIKEESFDSRESAELWVIESQLGRRNVSAYSRVILALKYEKVFRRRAKERQGSRADLRLISDGSKSASAMGEVGRVARVSRDTAYKVKKIKEHGPQEAKDQVAAGEISIHSAYRMALKVEHSKNLRASPLPKGKHDIIYADPPWHYKSDGLKHGQIAADRHYPTMTDEQLFSLPVRELAYKDSALFLWTTHAFLEKGLALLNHYGFSYKAHWVWHKDISRSQHKNTGNGFWNRCVHEILLFGTRGTRHVPKPTDRWPSVLKHPRTTHSAKPDLFYEMIEEMFPEARTRLELFSRKPRKGWLYWGNEHDIEKLARESA